MIIKRDFIYTPLNLKWPLVSHNLKASPVQGEVAEHSKDGGVAPIQCDLSHRNYSLFTFHYSFISA